MSMEIKSWNLHNSYNKENFLKINWPSTWAIFQHAEKINEIIQLPILWATGLSNLSVLWWIQKDSEVHFALPAPKLMCLWTKAFHLSGNHAEECSANTSNKQMWVTVHEVPFSAIACFPASHLESHINHLLFETDMIQREHTSDSKRGCRGEMAETESASGDAAENPPAWFKGSAWLPTCVMKPRWHVIF